MTDPRPNDHIAIVKGRMNSLAKMIRQLELDERRAVAHELRELGKDLVDEIALLRPKRNWR